MSASESATTIAATPPVTIIRPSSGWSAVNLADIWAHRELLYFLIWSDLKLRYKQTSLGAVWAVLQPFLTMVVYSIFLGRLARVPSDGIPYPIFVYTALVPWTFFSNALTQSSLSLIRHERVITKVYFPRLIIPVSAIGGGLIDLGISFVLLVGIIIYYGIIPGIAILLLPLFVLLATVTALAVSLWLSALNVQYRDVRYTVPFITQVWMFVTPVIYPASLVPERWHVLYGLNPMAGVVEGFRWSLLGQDNPSIPILLASASMTLVILIGGLYYFRRMERTFADVV
ncbi:MAG TPA: ABC transporter permease [Thermomicrobiales bacterium]|nr:ABC transporter permease [Thermomicrobiales bacterium]